MKNHEIPMVYKINNHGTIPMNFKELDDFAKKWKNATIIATFRVYAPGTSSALRGYYYYYIVPKFRRALWESGDRKTEEQTERYLREMSPIMCKETADPETGEYTRELRSIVDLDNSELTEHIEFLKQLGAEEFSLYIEDPGMI